MERYNVTEECYPYYSMSCEDKTPVYIPKWKQPPYDASPFLFDKLCPKPWRYQSSEDMGNSPRSSVLATYGGGGYVADLGYDLQTARSVMEALSKNNWIDRRTRALIVEFSIFNSNMNILVVANYFFEFLPTGGVYTNIKIEMLDLHGSETNLVQLILFCRLLVIVMMVAYFVNELVKMCRQKGTYFKNVWNWIALVLIITSVTAVVLHIVQEKTTSDSVRELNKNLYANVSFHKALSLLDMETTVFSFAIFLATLKFLTLLRFSRQIIFLSITVRLAAKYLASFSVVFVVIFCSFAISGILAFGALVESYSSFLRVCVSQFEFLLGKAVPNFQMAKVDPLLAFLFSSFYICSMTLFFLNLFIVILNYALGEVKDNLDAVTDELDLANFMTLYLTQGISNIFGRKKGKNSKLYCENISFEDDCAYVENRLDEITRRMTIMAEGTLTEASAGLIKPKIQEPQPGLYENQTENSNVIGDLEETLSSDEESSKSVSERDFVVEDGSFPSCSMALFTIVEMEETDEERNKPSLPSEINSISDDLNSWL